MLTVNTSLMLDAPSYAKLRGIKYRSVSTAINRGSTMPGVLKVQVIGNSCGLWIMPGWFEDVKVRELMKAKSIRVRRQVSTG